VVAYVNFHIPKWDLYLCGCKYIRKKNGGFFIAFPARKIEKNGEDKYYPYYCFEGDMSDRFQSAAQKAINEYVNKNQTSSSHRQTKDDELPF
jgi:hypothetical protein